MPKTDHGDPEYQRFAPTETDIEEAITARKAVKRLFKATSLENLSPIERKGLSSFSLGASGFILPPEISNEVAVLPGR